MTCSGNSQGHFPGNLSDSFSMNFSIYRAEFRNIQHRQPTTYVNYIFPIYSQWNSRVNFSIPRQILYTLNTVSILVWLCELCIPSFFSDALVGIYLLRTFQWLFSLNLIEKLSQSPIFDSVEFGCLWREEPDRIILFELLMGNESINESLLFPCQLRKKWNLESASGRVTRRNGNPAWI